MSTTSQVRDAIVKTLKDKGYEYQGECNWKDGDGACWYSYAVDASKGPPSKNAIQKVVTLCVERVREKCRDRKFWVHVYFQMLDNNKTQMMCVDIRLLK
jgi:hypothetical protein